jgi:hypothetical protein
MEDNDAEQEPAETVGDSPCRVIDAGDGCLLGLRELGAMLVE